MTNDVALARTRFSALACLLPPVGAAVWLGAGCPAAPAMPALPTPDADAGSTDGETATADDTAPAPSPASPPFRLSANQAYWPEGTLEAHAEAARAAFDACRDQTCSAVETALAGAEFAFGQAMLASRQADGAERHASALQGTLEALAAVLQEHREDPQADRAYFLLGLTLLEAQRPQEARVAWASLVREFPHSAFLPRVYLLFGEVLADDGDCSAALEYYEKVGPVGGGDGLAAYAAYRRALCLRALDRTDEAAGALDDVLRDTANCTTDGLCFAVHRAVEAQQ